MVAAENDGVFACGMGQLVHEAFIVKALLRRIDRPPCARILVRNMRKMPTRHSGQGVGEYRLVLRAFGLRIIIAVSGYAFFVGQRRRQQSRTLWAICALRDFFLPAPDQLDRIGQLHGKHRHLAHDFHIHGQAAAKAATDDHGVKGDIIGIKARNLNRHHFGRQRVLHPAPNVKLTVLILRGQRKGLHHRMVQERHLIFGFYGLITKASLHVAFACFAVGLSFGNQRVMCLENRCGGNAGMATVAKAGCQGA